MIKYVPGMTSVVLEEIPDRITLALEISNCQGNCVGCHSPFLREDVGEELTPAVLDALIAALLSLARWLRERHPRLERALYSGRTAVPEKDIWDLFDFVKVGPYKAECGPLNQRTTNQRLYYHGEDITARFWHRGIDPARQD